MELMMKMKIKMEQSPFYVERDEKTQKNERKSVRTDVSPEVFQDIEKYIMQRGDDFDRSKFVKELVMDFLNNHAFEQKVFRNLNAILLLPKSTNPDEINEKARVIGFIDSHEWLNITLANIFYGGGIDYPLRYNFMYTLKNFNAYEYNSFLHYFNRLYNYDDRIFFNIDEKTQQDFEKVKTRLSELYENIDLDDAYFVMFSFNNYLDVLKDGVYKSKYDENEHEGVIVLFEDISNGLIARIKWSYSHGELNYEFYFEELNKFESEYALELSNLELLQDFRKRTQMVSSNKGKLQFLRKQRLKEIEFLEFELEKEKKKLKELDEKLFKYGEDIS